MLSNSEAQTSDNYTGSEPRPDKTDIGSWFQLRGDHKNTLVDVAQPLFALSIRIRSMGSVDDVKALYSQVVKEINTVEMELTNRGYERAILMAYRYVLCAFLDEAVMSTSWGASSVWAEQSLLSCFHNETWGGEKVFLIVERIEEEPLRYRSLLEFIYYCLILGFEGKFRVMEDGCKEREKVISHVYNQLCGIDGVVCGELTKATGHVVNTNYKLGRQLPIWSIFAGFILLWAGIFLSYSYLLHFKSTDVLDQLSHIL